MASPLQALIATMVLVSLLVEHVRGIRYITESPNTVETKYSDFLVNIAPQAGGLIPGLGRFLLPPHPKTPFHPYKDPVAAAAPVPSYGIPSGLAPNCGYEAPSPSSGEDQVPPVPQP